MLAKVQLNKNQDGSWQKIEAATSKEQRGPVASAKLRRAPTMQDRMLSELKAKVEGRQVVDMSKLEDLERRREVLFHSPNKQPWKHTDPSVMDATCDDALALAPSDVLAKARLRAALVHDHNLTQAEKEMVPEDANQWPALKMTLQEFESSPNGNFDNQNNNSDNEEPEASSNSPPADLNEKACCSDDQEIVAWQVTETRSLGLEGISYGGNSENVPSPSSGFARRSSLDLKKGVARGAAPLMWRNVCENPLAVVDDMVVVEVEKQVEVVEVDNSFDISQTSVETGDSTSTDSETGAMKEVDSQAAVPTSKKSSKYKFLTFFKKADIGFFSLSKKDRSSTGEMGTSSAVSC